MWPNICATAASLFILFGMPIGISANPPSTQVLILENEQVLQGAVVRVGEQYRISRDGGETWVPANRVLTVCQNINAAFQFLVQRIEPKDADAHLRLARWCDRNGMRTQAAAEAKIAADLAPTRRVILATYRQLQRKAEAPAPQSAPAKLPETILNSTAIETIETGAESYKRFATKVQPILMNTCANCHVGDLTTKFHLERVFPGDLNSAVTTHRNLTVAMSAVDRVQPNNSPILQRAITAHGGAVMPPLRDRSVPAFKQLEEWVKIVGSDAPPSPAMAASPTNETVVGTNATAQSADAKSSFGVGVPKKEVQEGPKDPFDPAIFNQQHHPNAPKRDDPPKP